MASRTPQPVQKLVSPYNEILHIEVHINYLQLSAEHGKYNHISLNTLFTDVNIALKGWNTDIFAQGENKTAHYAICTGIMAIGMMLPGMVSGYIQEAIGYQNFFIWVCICTIPSFIVLKYLPFNSNFGKK